MKIYISHNRKQFNYKKELYEPLKNSQLSKDHIFIFPHDNNPQSFNAKIYFRTKVVIWSSRKSPILQQVRE